MVKHMLLAGAIAALPALAHAQDAAQPAPSQADMAAPPAQSVPAQPVQNPTARPGAAVATDAAPNTADQQAQPLATGDQVAQAVEQEFPTYDKNGDGSLDQSEFAAWMTELRTVSDPSVAAGSPDMAAWATQAFATADTDKNAVLSKAELIAFLSQGAS